MHTMICLGHLHGQCSLHSQGVVQNLIRSIAQGTVVAAQSAAED